MTEPSAAMGTLSQWAAVFVAGGLGAALRVALASWLEPLLVARLPHASVLVVNLLGCLLIGFAAVALSHAQHAQWRVIVLGGLLGGFTTYSAFALFSVELGQAGRFAALLVQIGAHVVGGIACVLLGSWLARQLGFAG